MAHTDKYRIVLDNIALSQMPQKVARPDVELAIGAAENLKPQPKMFDTTVITSQGVAVKQTLQEMSYEDTVSKGSGETLESDSYKKGFYLGGALSNDGGYL